LPASIAGLDAIDAVRNLAMQIAEQASALKRGTNDAAA
jgi:hypothetical protein